MKGQGQKEGNREENEGKEWAREGEKGPWREGKGQRRKEGDRDGSEGKEGDRMEEKGSSVSPVPHALATCE